MGATYLQPDVPAPLHLPQPAAHPGAFETFGAKTWWHQQSCQEHGCDAYLNGWVTTCDPATTLGRDQIDYIRFGSGRQFRETATEAGWVCFTFAPGQRCFVGSHPGQSDRPALFLRRGGDWRATVGDVHVYDNDEQFVDDLCTNIETIGAARSRAGTAGL